MSSSLTAPQVRALTLWKWRYHLETCGFPPAEAGRLLFLRWLVMTGRVQP